MPVITRLETISPQKSQCFLDNRAANRPIQIRYVERLKEEMLHDRFLVNGETIKIDNDGRMIDGQHRCSACVRANVPFRSFVTRGLPSGAFDTIDTGIRRTIGHVFSKHGEPNSNVLASAVSWVWRFDCETAMSISRTYPTHSVAIKVLDANPAIRDSIVVGRVARHVLPIALGTCLHYLFSKKNKEAANFFFSKLSDGDNIAKADPITSSIFLLRRRLLENHLAKAKLPICEICAITIKAWNAFRGKQIIRILAYKSRGSNRELPPEIQ